jgi:glycerol-3-phosphate dehydrogenase
MPLYGRGLKRPSIMGPALLLNDLLSLSRNAEVPVQKRLPRGRLVSHRFTVSHFPQIDRKGLQAGALWYDAAAPEHQRLFMEILRWVCALGATALNYIPAEELLLHQGQVRGVLASDRQTGQRHEFHSPLVINAAGPWCRQLAQKFDQDYPQLFRKNLLLFNILFKRKALSEYALALTPSNRRQHTYFIHNWKNRLLAGTAEILVAEHTENPWPQPDQIADFIFDMNQAVPDLDLTEKDIEHIYAGILPATASGTLSRRPVIIRHQDHCGPAGLFSVSGVKYTTSRLVAEKTMNQVFPGAPVKKSPPPAEANSGRGCFPYDWTAAAVESTANGGIKTLIAEEAVVHLDDLLFRRCGLGENRRRIPELLTRLRSMFAWSDLRWQQEKERLQNILPAQP